MNKKYCILFILYAYNLNNNCSEKRKRLTLKEFTLTQSISVFPYAKKQNTPMSTTNNIPVATPSPDEIKKHQQRLLEIYNQLDELGQFALEEDATPLE